MPGLVRKLIIFAIADGLILQSYGNHVDQAQALRLEWQTARLTPWKSTPTDQYKQGPHAESHGVVGLLSIASYSYLIAISRREQVAQILGKPIYVIKDISIVPLSSKADADKVLRRISSGASKEKDIQSDSDSSGDDTDTYGSLDESEDPATPSRPTEKPPHNRSESSIAQDVIGRKGQYGRFAAQWFSRSGWNQEKKRTMGLSTESDPVSERLTNAAKDPPEKSPTDGRPPSADDAEPKKVSSSSAAVELMPKLLRTTKLLFASRSYYFSYDINISQRFGSDNFLWSKAPSQDTFDPLGFVGQREFIAQRPHRDSSHTEAVESLERILESDSNFSDSPAHKRSASSLPQPFLLTLISRRSVKRSGLRYLRRGIDDESNTANSVETEQILSSPKWEDSSPIHTYLQFRGSLPLYFSQSPYAFKPVPVLHQNQDANQSAFNQHFTALRQKYGDVQIALLLDKHGVEANIGEQYQAYTERFNKEQKSQLGFEWFDFHAECRGMKFENVKLLIDKLGDTVKTQGETVLRNKAVEQKQTGIIRTNCMDCLDRTNVVQSAFGQHLLEQELRQQGFDIDLRLDPSTQWFNTLWADNGDAISRQYAGSAALKGDFTRTRKRDYRGALNDLSLTLTRYYNNVVNDFFAQSVIDYLLGNVTVQAFEDFESSMMSSDPGVSIDRIRQNSIDSCARIVIPNENEDLVHGWTVLTPSIPNTIRAMPFVESVLLLTDKALYGCKFDTTTLKVLSFERVDLRSVTRIQYGVYVTSTLTEGQMDESWNMGIVITFSPGKGSMIRVNTRSLQNEIDPAKEQLSSEDPAEKTVFSWLSKKTNEDLRFMAVKVIPAQSSKVEGGPELLQQVEHIVEDIRRGIEETSLPPSMEGESLDVEQRPIISVSDAKKRTGYLEQLGYQVKRLVWA